MNSCTGSWARVQGTKPTGKGLWFWKVGAQAGHQSDADLQRRLLHIETGRVYPMYDPFRFISGSQPKEAGRYLLRIVSEVLRAHAQFRFGDIFSSQILLGLYPRG